MELQQNEIKIVLLLHTCHHLTVEGIGLRHLCDWAVFVNHLTNDTFRALFEVKLKAIGLWRFAQLLSQLSTYYLGMPEQEWAMQDVDEALLYAMIRDIFKGGNFGVKDSQRIYETMILPNEGETSMLQSNATAAFIVDCLKQPTTEDAIVDAVLGHYTGVDRATAADDVREILEKLRSIHALDEA
jgi:hypothetical protein